MDKIAVPTTATPLAIIEAIPLIPTAPELGVSTAAATTELRPAAGGTQ